MTPIAPPASPITDDQPLNATVLYGAQGFAELRDEWLDLFRAVPAATWSCAPEIFASWIETLRDLRHVHIVAVRDRAGVLRGIYPLMRDFAWRGLSVSPRFDYDPQDRVLITNRRVQPIPVRQLTVMASLPATLLWIAPLCLPEYSTPVTNAIAGAILDIPGWDVLILPSFEGTQVDQWRTAFQAAGVPLRVQTLNREVSNLRNVAPFEQVIADTSGKFRQNVRRARKVADKVGLKFTIHTGQQEVAAQLGAIATVAAHSWKHEGRSGAQVHIAYAGRQQKFFERFLVSEDLGGTPVVGVASDAKGPLAVLVMVHFGGSVSALLTFWDGRQDKASPGLLLFGAAIDWAAQQGATRFEFNTAAPWARYLVDTSQTVCNLVVFKPALYGRSLGHVARLSGRLP